MSRNQIGTFIQQLRKEKGLTQKELGSRINVSDKTISKWENSNSIPDTTILPALCEALDITVNELLYGEKLPPEDYSKKAEENIMNLLQEEQKNKKAEIGKWILGIILLIGVALTNLGIMQADALWYVDIWSALVPFGLCGALVLLSGKNGKGATVQLLRKIVMPVGLLVTLTAAICVLGSVSDLRVLAPNLAVALLSFVYSIIAYVVLCVLETRMKK